MHDYQKELDKYKDALSEPEKQELQKLAASQKDIAVGDSAEDFIRHPFFRSFEQEMNRLIDESGRAMAELVAKSGTTMEDLKSFQGGIEKIKALKRWLNKHVIAGRVARQAISIYEDDTETMNARIQAAVDNAATK